MAADRRANVGAFKPQVFPRLVLVAGLLALPRCGPPVDAEGRPVTIGRVRLRTFPKGAEAWVDGKVKIVKTPATLVLPAGPHRLRIRARGARAIEREIYVEAGRSKDITIRIPDPPPARLHVFSDVVGADVRVNGYRRGETPLIGAMTKPGPIDVTVSAGVQARSVQSFLAIGEQKTVEVFFGAGPTRAGPGVCRFPPRLCRPPPKGFLTLGMKPKGKVFDERGRTLGDSPLVRVPLEPGEHTLTLRTNDGLFQRQVQLRVEPGETAVFRFLLTGKDRVPQSPGAVTATASATTSPSLEP